MADDNDQSKWPLYLAAVSLGALLVQFILAAWTFMQSQRIEKQAQSLRLEHATLNQELRQESVRIWGDLRLEHSQIDNELDRDETKAQLQQETNNLRFAMLEAWRKEQEKTDGGD